VGRLAGDVAGRVVGVGDPGQAGRPRAVTGRVVTGLLEAVVVEVAVVDGLGGVATTVGFPTGSRVSAKFDRVVPPCMLVRLVSRSAASSCAVAVFPLGRVLVTMPFAL
jgi:hypothetical protein